MKLISLWEPWATLMALGAKKIETRHWYTPYRGWLAIHATKGGLSRRDLIHQCRQLAFADALKALDGFDTRNFMDIKYREVFSFGCIIAVARLVECKMFVDTAEALAGRNDIRMMPPPDPEFSFGNYEAGRYGFICDSAFRLPQPIPFTSRQGKLLDVSPDVLDGREWNEMPTTTEPR